MEKKRSKGVIGFGLIISLLVSGCINYEQETVLNSNMSGVIKIHIFVNPEAIASGMMDSLPSEERIAIDDKSRIIPRKKRNPKK